MTKLKRARLLSGKRQIDIYNEVGIWPARLSMIENGLVTPRENEIQTLAKIFETTPEQIYDFKNSQRGPIECAANCSS